jgi:hypothetical protein
VSWFSRIEEACAAFIERAFANMFPADLEPAQIARKLVATMEARTQTSDSGMAAPSRYTVYVHPSDFDRLLAHRAYLEDEWSALLGDVAQRVGIRFAGPPRVTLGQSDRIVPGATDVRAIDEIADETAPHPRADGRTFVLRVLKGMPADGAFSVSGATRVGRKPEMDIFLVDPSVSRNHALLDVHGGELVVRDAGSTNGTFVNGERVQLRALRSGDRIAFGNTEMLVEAQER